MVPIEEKLRLLELIDAMILVCVFGYPAKYCATQNHLIAGLE